MKKLILLSVLCALPVAAMNTVKPADRELMDAVYAHDVRRVQQALDNGADVNYVSKTTPLATAAINGSVAIVQLLIARGANIYYTADGQTARDAAQRNDRIETVRLLDRAARREEGMNEDPANPALMAGVSRRDLSLVQEALNRGADANYVDEHGNTPLIAAAMRGNVQLVRLLLGHRADTDFADSQGWTALMYAADNGNVEIVQLLINHGADLNHKSNLGRTARDFAVDAPPGRLREVYAEIVTLLDQAAADRKKAPSLIKGIPI